MDGHSRSKTDDWVGVGSVRGICTPSQENLTSQTQVAGIDTAGQDYSFSARRLARCNSRRRRGRRKDANHQGSAKHSE